MISKSKDIPLDAHVREWERLGNVREYRDPDHSPSSLRAMDKQGIIPVGFGETRGYVRPECRDGQTSYTPYASKP